jgi:hypothetical protein
MWPSLEVSLEDVSVKVGDLDWLDRPRILVSLIGMGLFGLSGSENSVVPPPQIPQRIEVIEPSAVRLLDGRRQSITCLAGATQPTQRIPNRLTHVEDPGGQRGQRYRLQDSEERREL